VHSRFFEISHDMLCIAKDGYLLHANGAWSRELGWTLEELRSRPLEEFVHPDDRDRTRIEGERLKRTQSAVYFRNRYRTKAGAYRWIDWRAVVDPETGETYAAARDVSDVVEVQDRLEDRERTLTRLVGHQLQVRDDEQRRIASELHDSTLQHLIAASILLESDASPAGVERALSQVRASIDATRRIMDGLDPLESSSTDIETALRTIAADLGELFPMQFVVEADCATEIPPEAVLATYRASREAMINAAKHSGASQVTARASHAGGRLLVQIVDDGGGMSVPSSGSHAKGSGLGIPLMHERMRLVGGAVRFEPTTHGTSVVITVPTGADESTPPAAGDR